MSEVQDKIKQIIVDELGVTKRKLRKTLALSKIWVRIRWIW
jgi:hypothetical protein